MYLVRETWGNAPGAVAGIDTTGGGSADSKIAPEDPRVVPSPVCQVPFGMLRGDDDDDDDDGDEDEDPSRSGSGKGVGKFEEKINVKSTPSDGSWTSTAKLKSNCANAGRKCRDAQTEAYIPLHGLIFEVAELYMKVPEDVRDEVSVASRVSELAPSHASGGSLARADSQVLRGTSPPRFSSFCAHT